MSPTIVPAPVRKNVYVNAAPARAFQIFTASMGRWWIRAHHFGRVGFRDVILQPRVGGRWFERGEDESEQDWGKVLVWEPPARAVLAWQIDGSWRYNPDVLTEVEIRFIAEGTGTRVELEHRNLDRLGEHAAATRHALDSPDGWAAGLAAFAGEITRAT